VQQLTSDEPVVDEDVHLLSQRSLAQSYQTQISCENTIAIMQMIDSLERRMQDAGLIKPDETSDIAQLQKLKKINEEVVQKSMEIAITERHQDNRLQLERTLFTQKSARIAADDV